MSVQSLLTSLTSVRVRDWEAGLRDAFDLIEVKHLMQLEGVIHDCQDGEDDVDEVYDDMAKKRMTMEAEGYLFDMPTDDTGALPSVHNPHFRPYISSLPSAYTSHFV